VNIKPYRQIPIQECGESLVAIPKDTFAFFEPHPYLALGAPYGNASPWFLRKDILTRLQRAQRNLQQFRPSWKIKLFDAYRPNEVQAFMVEREFHLQAKATGLDPVKDQDKLYEKAYRVFAIPSEDPLTPPPHSTGAAIDCTLADETGQEVDMGSPIDENSDRSNPDYYATAADAVGKQAEANRMLLNEVMVAEGFHRHESEWWHFSYGDQIWAWTERQKNPGGEAVAIYGRARL